LPVGPRPRRLRERGKFFGFQLGIAAGNNDRKRRFAKGEAYKTPCPLFGLRGDGTGIDYTEYRLVLFPAFPGNNLKAGAGKRFGYGFCFKLIEFTSKGIKRNAGHLSSLPCPFKPPLCVNKLGVKGKGCLIGVYGFGVFPGAFPGIGEARPPFGVLRHIIHSRGKGDIRAVKFSKPDKNFPDIVIHHVDRASLRGKIYVFLKKLKRLGIASLEIIHFAKYLDNPGIITVYVSSRLGIGTGFFITAQGDKALRDKHMRFKVIGIISYFPQADFHGSRIITVAEFTPRITLLGKCRS
jgi:hypothetical protein